jgi:ATP-dependent DNA helicase PIF1
LKKIGTGVTTDEQHRVHLPASLTLTESKNIIDFVFPPECLDKPLLDANLKRISGSALLCPTNDEALKFNNQILDQIPGEVTTFKSIDEPINQDPLDCLAVYESDRCIENLNRQTPQGLPPHELCLKIGAIMMLIKNLDIPGALCNGTRVQIVEIRDNILICRYIEGPFLGQNFSLYKCKFEHGGGKSGQNESAFKWQRIQFPLRPGFVLTINKAQGQTLDRVGVLLQRSQCFSPGQLYVAASRVRDPNSLK